MNSDQTAHVNLWLREGLLFFSPVASAQTPILDLEGFLVLPGLINAHDHLELNLFPRLGHGTYPNASAWAKDIYRPHESPIKDHLGVPKPLRLRWGGIKNLLSGVTTVAHHNAFHPVFLDPVFRLRVVKRYGWAHSLHFSPDWKTRFLHTPADLPFVIHAAEGTDEAAGREIQILARAGVLNQSTVLVHGVGIGSSDVTLLKHAQTSLVWCPTSNHFTLKRSLAAVVLHSSIAIALGSDSALTAEGDLLDELLVAHRTIDAQRLYRMVTSEPARMFKLPAGFGQICDGGPADLLVMKDGGDTPAVSLLKNYPQLVIIGGRVQLVAAELAGLCPRSLLAPLQPLEVEGRGRYLIAGDISSLFQETKGTLRENPRLAGKAVAA